MQNKIYCCFQFFSELEILKLKLEELYNVVDFFIISESLFTHSGQPKSLYFEENKHLFKKYSSKIIHQIVRDTPSNYQELLDMKPINSRHKKIIDCVKNSYWFNKNIEGYLRDTYEKEMLFFPLAKCEKEDIIILGDCDEIPKAETLQNIIDNFDKEFVYHMQHSVFYYYLNLRKNEPWYGNMVLSYEKFEKNSFCEMRQNKKGIFIENGGWHFSYQKGIDAIKNKIESFGEQSINLDWVKNGLENSIDNAIELGRDLYNRPCKFWIEPVHYETHPKYLVDHQNEFVHMIKKV